MIVFECPTRSRSKPTSVNVEEFIARLRVFVESKLGRPLPDFQTNGLNRLFAIFETMPGAHGRALRLAQYKVKGCEKKVSVGSDVVGYGRPVQQTGM